MKPFVKIIRKVDIEKQYEHILQLELDYELASLFAMNEKMTWKLKKVKTSGRNSDGT